LGTNAEESKHIQQLFEQTVPVPGKTIADEHTTTQWETDGPIDVIMDSTFAKNFEVMFNKLTKADLSELARQKLNKDITNGLLFYFNDSDDPSKVISVENIYVQRKNAAVAEKLQWFLENFHKESYRSAGTLSMKILSICTKDKKIYIEYDYVYTPKEDKKPDK